MVLPRKKQWITWLPRLNKPEGVQNSRVEAAAIFLVADCEAPRTVTDGGLESRQS